MAASKLRIDTPGAFRVNWKLRCQLCNNNYPLNIAHQNYKNYEDMNILLKAIVTGSVLFSLIIEWIPQRIESANMYIMNQIRRSVARGSDPKIIPHGAKVGAL
mgnify:CR=1 FL=1